MTAFVEYGELLVPSAFAEAQEAAAAREASADWKLEFDAPYNRTTWSQQLGIHPNAQLYREWLPQERFQELTRSHMVWERDPIANSIVSYTTQFVVGSGINVTYQSAEVEDVLEEFMNDPDNDFFAQEKQLCDSLQVDGEIFLRFFKNDGGRTLIAPLQPFFVWWVKVDINFRKRVLAYIYRATLTDGYFTSQYFNEEIPADEVIHVKINCMPYELRGRPELTRIMPYLKAYSDWIQERIRLNRRKSVYYHIKLKNATPGQVTATRNAYKEPPPPGSMLVTNDNVEMNELSSKIGATDASDDGRHIKLMALAGARLPEYFFAEGQTANRASTTSQQLPALRKFEDFKELLADFWTAVFRRVLQNAIDAGRIPEEVAQVKSTGEPVLDEETGEPVMLDALDAFDASYAGQEQADPFMEAQAVQLDMTNGLVSKETASVKRGYDYAVEQKKLEQEQATAMAKAYDAAQQGMTPDGKLLPPPLNPNHPSNQSDAQQAGGNNRNGNQADQQKPV